MITQPDNPKGAGDPHYYGAYGTVERKLYALEIRPVLGMWHAPSYDYLTNVVPDGDSGTKIELLYSFMQVKITGRNLQSLSEVLEDGTCKFIQEYDPNYFTPPAPDAPVITQIEFIMSREHELLLH